MKIIRLMILIALVLYLGLFQEVASISSHRKSFLSKTKKLNKTRKEIKNEKFLQARLNQDVDSLSYRLRLIIG